VSRDAAGPRGEGDLASLPVVEEALHVDRRTVATHTVRVSKTIEAHEVEVAVPLERRSVSIERVVVNRVVDVPEPSRREGDLTIVPVYEEVLVKRWLLKEELRIGIVAELEPGEPVRTVLRREVVDVVRTPIADAEAPRPAERPSTPSQDPRP
jgi:stress response protein YsnF